MTLAALSPQELVRTCAESADSAAWEEFVRRFQPLISRVVLRTARRWGATAPEFLDDLVQETFLKLCAENGRLLTEFQGHHPDAIYGFVKVVAGNLVHDHFKAQLAAKRGSGETATSLDDVEVAAREGAEAVERGILLQQVDGFLKEALPRDRTIFWLYYRQGLSASAIAALPSVSLTTKGVESTILRLTRLVRGRLAPPPAEGIATAGSF